MYISIVLGMSIPVNNYIVLNWRGYYSLLLVILYIPVRKVKVYTEERHERLLSLLAPAKTEYERHVWQRRYIFIFVVMNGLNHTILKTEREAAPCVTSHLMWWEELIVYKEMFFKGQLVFYDHDISAWLLFCFL